MSAFEIPVRAVRRLLPVALLSAAACGGNVFYSSGGAGAGGGSLTAGAGGGEIGGGSSAGAGAGGTDIGGGSFGGQTAGGSNGGQTYVGGACGSSAGAGGTDTQACISNQDCEVIPKGCCSCGSGPVSNYVAINSAYATQYQSECGVVDCAACLPTAFNPNDPVNYYVATCARSVSPDLPSGGVTIAGQCVVVDLRATDITACKLASDCSLRGGTGCCSRCGGGTPIAINTSEESELETEACDGAPQACPACAPAFSGYDATCSDGRCSVELAPLPPPCPCPD
jgi:hypothetical protein